MKIQCLPRKWFERIKGTVLEKPVLAHNKVVPIKSRSGWDSEQAFSEEGLSSPNLLCLIRVYMVIMENMQMKFASKFLILLLAAIFAGCRYDKA